MNKREAVLSLLDPRKTPPYVPGAFFLHFDQQYRAGQAAVEKHLEYFRRTGMDFVKIQYERNFPRRPEIERPADWARMPSYGLDFYEPQLEAVAGLVKAAGREALVVQTLYSPFMCAGHTTSGETITRHILDDPEAVKAGMQAITDSLMGFVRECIRLGVDGFYTSTQGGEAGRFPDRRPFEECIKPYDLALMQEANAHCHFNILHVCDYSLPYDDLSPFLEYPGQVVNCSLRVGDRMLSGREVSTMFGRPYMGGMDRHGVIASGGPSEIQAAVRELLETAPERYILGADCTLPADASWDNIRIAIEAAHAGRA